MPRMVPRHQSSVLVIRVKKEIIADRGQYLVVDEDAETVEVWSAEEVAQHYRPAEAGRRAPVSATRGADKRARTPPATPPTRHSVDVGGKTIRVSGQLARILCVLPHVGDKFRSSDLDRSTDLSDSDRRQASARLTDASRLGLVESMGKSDRGAITWRLTNNGRFLAQKLSES